MRPLTLLQRQRITLSLFFTVAVGAVFTVATPAFVPWKVVDDKRAQALDQQRRQGKDFHVIENRGRSRGDSSSDEQGSDPVASTSHNSASTSSSISHQGPLVSLLTDRSHQSLTEEGARLTDAEQPVTEATTKKRRRRRKRKMVNEGWQEFTGRTAREEKEKEEKDKHKQHIPQSTASELEPLGENGGREISWKNKAH
ncbi:hypothetical protein BGZ95_008071 [Linnemannia exigua]|uniref:Transmembrane protein n=1 Tax=Linnemannia exigua TaxID=604196 RepID=A0AAD4DMH2_9FUNG|nr:hypothetical protein BGZ95_008071 [Linnemannia exigua]